MKRAICLSLLIAVAGLTPVLATGQSADVAPAVNEGKSTDSDVPTQEAPSSPVASVPIRSQADLDAYLQRNRNLPTPLDRFSPGARQRFLGSLVFGSKGLSGFSTDDLHLELTTEEIRRVLALFGPEVEAFAATIEPSKATTSASSAPPSDIERRFNLLYRTLASSREASDVEFANMIAHSYADLFPDKPDPSTLQGMSDTDLGFRFRAADIAATAIRDTKHADAMLLILGQMQARDQATSDHLAMVHRQLIAARRFDEANRFASKHPDAKLEPLPQIRNQIEPSDDRPTLWRLSANAQTLTRSPIDLGPTQVIVTAGCHFSENAAEDISADPVLGPIFANHARWLSLPPGVESITLVAKWNRDHPKTQMEMIYDRADWSMFDRWSMPTFHIVRDGKVVESLSGWPRNPQDNRQPLLDVLRRAGLLETPVGRVTTD